MVGFDSSGQWRAEILHPEMALAVGMDIRKYRFQNSWKEGWGILVAECLPGVCEALGMIPSFPKQQKS